jgi:pentatricopeptide repeat protein
MYSKNIFLMKQAFSQSHFTHYNNNQTTITTNYRCYSTIKGILLEAEEGLKEGDLDLSIHNYEMILSNFNTQENVEEVVQSLYRAITRMGKSVPDRFMRVYEFCLQHNLLKDAEFSKVVLIGAFKLPLQLFQRVFDQTVQEVIPFFTTNGGNVDLREFFVPLIHCYLKGHQGPRAQMAYKKLLDLGGVLSTDELNPIINLTIKHHQQEFKKQLIDYVKQKRIEFNREQLQYRLAAYTAVEQMDNAVYTFNRIRSKGEDIDYPVYLILLEGMKRVDFNDRFKGFARNVLEHLATVRFDKIEDRFIRDVAGVLSRIGSPELTNSWLNSLLEHSTEVATFNAVLSALCNSNLFSKAFELYNEMETKYGITPQVETYNTLLAACDNDDDLKLILTQMDEKKVTKDLASLNIRINYLCKQGKIQEALEMFNKLKAACIQSPALTPNNFTLTILAKAVQNDPELMKSLYESSKELEVQIDRPLSNYFITSCNEYREDIIAEVLDARYGATLFRVARRLPDLFPKLFNYLEQTNDDRLPLVVDVLDRYSIRYTFQIRNKR